MKFIDLFSGIGGFRLGFESEGNECVFSADFDKHACESYQKNFGDFPLVDIASLDAKDVPDHDILCGGFPCQDYSVATTLKNSKVVKSTKKVGGLIQSGLERVGKTIKNVNQIVIATQSGYERGEAIIKEEVATRLLLKGLEIDRDQAIKFQNKRFEKGEIDNEGLNDILKEVNKIYDARDKIYNDRLETLKEDKDQLKS